MNQMKGKRIIISGLVSSKLNLDEYLVSIRGKIVKEGGEIVGELIQRRGVSRSKKAGGSNKLDLPLSSRTFISSGKFEELKKLSDNLNSDIILFLNNLTESQIQNLEDLIETKVTKIITE